MPQVAARQEVGELLGTGVGELPGTKCPQVGALLGS